MLCCQGILINRAFRITIFTGETYETQSKEETKNHLQDWLQHKLEDGGLTVGLEIVQLRSEEAGRGREPKRRSREAVLWRRFTGLAVSYRESNWTPEYDVPPSHVWTLQPGLLHESFADTFPSLGKRILDGEVSWSNHPNFDGEFSFTKGYWEWAEDILSHYGKVLRKGSIYDVVYASLFTYDRNTSIIQAFCEAWCPLTNTLVTSQGEVTISLRDLHILGVDCPYLAKRMITPPNAWV
nr:Cytochrome P450 71A6 [Ipomoea batatas]